MNKREIINEIDKLIKDYKEAHLKARFDDLSDLHNPALVENLITRALHLIEIATKEGSVFRKQAYRRDGSNKSIGQLIGILYAVKEEVPKGEWFDGFRKLIYKLMGFLKNCTKKYGKNKICLNVLIFILVLFCLWFFRNQIDWSRFFDLKYWISERLDVPFQNSQEKADPPVPGEAIKAVNDLKEQIAIQNQDCIFLTRAELQVIPITKEINNSAMTFYFRNSCRVPINNIKSSWYSLYVNRSVGYKELVTTSAIAPEESFRRTITAPIGDFLGKDKFFVVTVEQGGKTLPKAYCWKINYLSGEYKDFISQLVQVTPDEKRVILNFLKEQGIYDVVKILEQ